MKHTPGPWSVSVEESDAENRPYFDIRALASIATVWSTPEDARLISAAPDVVEALLDAIAVIEAHINMTGTYKRGIYGHLPSSCRDALRKIRGE